MDTKSENVSDAEKSDASLYEMNIKTEWEEKSIQAPLENVDTKITLDDKFSGMYRSTSQSYGITHCSTEIKSGNISDIKEKEDPLCFMSTTSDCENDTLQPLSEEADMESIFTGDVKNIVCEEMYPLEQEIECKIEDARILFHVEGELHGNSPAVQSLSELACAKDIDSVTTLVPSHKQKKMKMTEDIVLQDLELLTNDEDKTNLIRRLTEWGLVPAEGEYKCPRCDKPLRLGIDRDRTDGLRWTCNAKRKNSSKKTVKCSTRVEFRTGTFFARSRLSLFQILGFVNLWVDNVSLTNVCKQLKMAKTTAIDWASFCREVVLDTYIVHRQKLGGVGKTVEIGKSKFGKRKYHRGRNVEGQWVFGGYERGTGRIFMVSVEDRDSETLLPIIRDWIEPGTTIVSDFWKNYDCLSLEGYEYLKVNHSLNFKDLKTNGRTNKIESLWQAAKATMSSFGRRKAHIPGNLARYMFQKKCAELKLDRTVEFFRLTGLMYNPLVPSADQRDEDYTDESDREEEC